MFDVLHTNTQLASFKEVGKSHDFNLLKGDVLKDWKPPTTNIHRKPQYIKGCCFLSTGQKHIQKHTASQIFSTNSPGFKATGN